VTGAVIFDLDGTVLDNEGEWESVFRQVAENNNLQSKGAWIHEPGIGITANWKRHFSSDPGLVDKLTRETWNLYNEMFKVQSAKFKVREGIVDLVAKIKGLGWMTALCTSSTWNVVEPELAELNMYLAFDVTTTGEEVLLAKPDPEIFLLTTQKLGVEPGECLVIEDSLAGVRAASSGGMKSAGLVSGYAGREELLQSGATWAVYKIEEIGQILDGLVKLNKSDVGE